MRKIIHKICCLVIGLGLLVGLAGCSTSMALPKPGEARITESSRTTMVMSPDGTQTTTEDREVTTEIKQPESPKGPTPIKYESEDGKTSISTEISPSHDNSSVFAAASNVRSLTWIGAAMILLGVGVAWFLKQVKWGVVIGAVGISLIVLGFLLVQYPMVFLIGAILGGLTLLAFGGNFLYQYFVRSRANKENVALIETIKNEYLTDEQKKILFNSNNSIAALAQSDSTKKLVKEIKSGK